MKRTIERIAVMAAKDRPVFVGASPRSGTTLLRTMLNSHPSLAIPRENRFVARAFALREMFGDLSDTGNREKFVDWIIHRPGFHKLELDPERAFTRMMAAPSATVGSVVGTPLLMYAEERGAQRWGDKRPAHVRCTGRIFSMFPDAQFVHLVRDPRGSVASMKTVGWYSGSTPKAVELWVRSIEAAEAAKESLRPDQFYELNYEKLLRDPEKQLQKLAKWLGLAPDGIERMLEFHLDSDVPDGRYHWRVSQPIDPAAATGWKTTLDEDALALIEHVTRNHMDRLGYQRCSRTPDPREDLVQEYQRELRNNRPSYDTTKRTDRPHIAAQLTSGQRRRAEMLRVARKFKRAP